MTKYGSLSQNKEVIDALCCIALGYDKVKDIMVILKQPQSTVSEKLRFLLANRVISKKKWKFKVNWNKLCKLLWRTIVFQFNLNLIDSKLNLDSINHENSKRNELNNKKELNRVVQNIEGYFPKGLLRNMFLGYSYLCLDNYPKLSVFDISNNFLDQLAHQDGRQLKEIDEEYGSKLVEVKRLLKFRMTDEEFFFTVLTDSSIKDTYGNTVIESLNKRIEK